MRPPPAKTQDKKYKTRMCRYGAGTCPYGVSCSYAHSAVVFRAELNILFAPSTRKRVGPHAGGAPAVRARRAAGRADRRREPARAAPRPPRQRQRLGGRVRGAQAAGPARAGLVRGPGPGAARADGAATAAAPVPAAAGRLHAARDADAAARGAATAGVRPAATIPRGAGAAAPVWRATVASAPRHAAAAVRGSFAAASSWLRVSVRGSPAATAAAGFWVRAWRLATLRRFAPVNANRRRLSRLAALFLRVPALCPLSPPHAMPRGCFKRDPGRKLEYCRRHLSMPFGASWGENALWPKIKLKSIGRISSRRASLPN